MTKVVGIGTPEGGEGMMSILEEVYTPDHPETPLGRERLEKAVWRVVKVAAPTVGAWFLTAPDVLASDGSGSGKCVYCLGGIIALSLVAIGIGLARGGGGGEEGGTERQWVERSDGAGFHLKDVPITPEPTPREVRQQARADRRNEEQDWKESGHRSGLSAKLFGR